MTIDPIIALPAVASVAVIYYSSVEAAFYRVYLPILLLLPDAFLFGWPPLNFNEYALLPIGVVLCWWCLNGRWRWSLTDAGVLLFIAWTIISDIHAGGLTDIVYRILKPIMIGLLPYMAGKLLIEQTGMRVAIIRRFVFCLFVDSIISVYEFRLGVNPFRMVFGRFFSTYDPWFTQFRYGLGRIAGPFGHAIFMGAMLAVAIILHRYVMRFGLWERRFSWFPRLRIDKAKTMLVGLIAGSLMTISRGPWLATIVGLIIAFIGTAQNRWRAARLAVIVLVIGGGLVYLGGKSYVSTSQGDKESQEELASAEYRTRLMAEYSDIASQQKLWGWGSTDWPHVPGMGSIDNWYLLLMLMYGITGLVLFVLMLLAAVVHLLWVGLLDNTLTLDQRGMLFTLAGIVISIAVAIATVFLGGQVFPALFLFLGWGDACLLYRPKRAPVVAAAPAFAFRRVIA
jgi:hypothetical protein